MASLLTDRLLTLTVNQSSPDLHTSKRWDPTWESSPYIRLGFVAMTYVFVFNVPLFPHMSLNHLSHLDELKCVIQFPFFILILVGYEMLTQL